MLRWSVLFLVLGLIAGLLGFAGLEGTMMQFARILFFLFIVLFVISLIFGRRAGGPVV